RDDHLGVGAVVLHQQLHRPAEEAAAGVYLVHAELVAVAVLGAGDRELAGERQRRSEHDRVAFRRLVTARVGGLAAGGRGRIGAALGGGGGSVARSGSGGTAATAGREHHGENRHQCCPSEFPHWGLLTSVSSSSV